MASDIQGIPPAPRRVLWRSVLGYRWPLGLGAFVFAVYGGVWAWMLFLGSYGTDRDLDRSGRTIVRDARVTAIDAEVGVLDGAPAERVHYVFTHQGHDWTGTSFARAGSFVTGQQVEVVALPGDFTKNRIAGTRDELPPPLLDPSTYVAAVIVPGLLLGIGYLASVFHLRHVLVHGDVSLARILSVQPVRFVMPQMLSVRFEFRDHHARPRRSRHWVRAHSSLGRRLAIASGHQNPTAPVLHDRRFPQHCRLVLPEGFLPAQPSSVQTTLPT